MSNKTEALIKTNKETLNLCSDYDIGCRIDEKKNLQTCVDCFYGIGFENSPYWNGADGYCPILRRNP